MASIKLLYNQLSTPTCSNCVALLVVHNGLIGLSFNANSTINSFSDFAVLAYQMTCVQTIAVTMATINLESREVIQPMTTCGRLSADSDLI